MCYFNNNITEWDGNQFKIFPQIVCLLWLGIESKNNDKQMWDEGTPVFYSFLKRERVFQNWTRCVNNIDYKHGGFLISEFGGVEAIFLFFHH